MRLSLLSLLLFYWYEETESTFKKKALYWGLAYCFRELVHDHHGGEHGSGQAGMVLGQ